MKGESARTWKWIKDIQATKHEHSCITGNKNIQSKLQKAHQGNGNETEWITHNLKKENTEMS